MANYASYSDFNNHSRPLRPDSRILVKDSLNESVDRPFLSTEDWKVGENTWESKTKSRERSLAWEERKKGMGEFMRRGNNKQRIAFGVFTFCCALGITLFFVIPRVPIVYWLNNKSLTSTDTRPVVTSIPAQFSFNANATIAFDSGSYISTKITNVQVSVYYLITEVLVASGHMDSLSIPLQKITNVNFPLTFSGTFNNSTNPTYQAIRSACNKSYIETPRTSLSLSMGIFYSVEGVVGRFSSASQFSDVDCPIIFSGNSS